MNEVEGEFGEAEGRKGFPRTRGHSPSKGWQAGFTTHAEEIGRGKRGTIVGGGWTLKRVKREGMRRSCPANPSKSPDHVHPLPKTLWRCSEIPPSDIF